MPNRILKESICTSDTISKLSWFEEICFYRLIVNADDYGRFDGRLPILKSRMFPLEDVTEKQIGDAINKLRSAGIVTTYTVEEKPYLQIVTWANHQQIRNKRSKYPSIDDADSVSDINGNHLISIDIKCPRNPIQSNPNPNPNPNVCTERYDDRSMQEPIIVIELPLNDKTMYAVTVEDVKKYKELYQAVDVEQELRKMLGWLDANPSKRKTSRGIKRFITNWLSKEQDKSGTRNRAPTYRSDRDNRGNFSTSFDDYEYDDGALTRVTMPRIEGSP